MSEEKKDLLADLTPEELRELATAVEGLIAGRSPGHPPNLAHPAKFRRFYQIKPLI
jgi:hypothetical protein